jgi:putative ATP-binding cassette transporter
MIEALKVVAFLLRLSRGVPGARFKTVTAIATGLLCGMVYPGLVALINTALHRPFDRTLLLGFLALCVLGPASRLLSQMLFDSVGTSAILELRMQLCRKILATPLRDLEEIGASRLLAALADDVTSITAALSPLPMLCMQIAVIVTALGYMLWLSPGLFLLVLAGLLLTVASYRIPVLRTGVYFDRLRVQTDAMFAHFRDLIYGGKELKLHRQRRETFVAADLIPTGEAMRRSLFAGNSVVTAANTWGNLLFFLVLGVLLFGLGGRETRMEVLAGYTLALLYLKTPLEVFTAALPTLGRAATAAATLDRLGVQLAPSTAVAETRERESRPSWRTIEMVDVRHAYHVAGEESAFAIGPIRLTLNPGEIVFLIGGNGSGKTSLAKVLIGLYAPESGEVRLDGVPVTDENRDDYRQMFGAVFADYYLFDKLVGKEGADAGADAARYLEQFDLGGKVRIEDGSFSTVDLSQGQRKRLALIAACLEDRPIYLFDEWAADQDPHFKEIYYREILPGLKARGKTVVVISHDDRYYPLADRLIKLSNGQIEWERRPDEMDPAGAPRPALFNETLGPVREARPAGT